MPQGKSATTETDTLPKKKEILHGPLPLEIADQCYSSKRARLVLFQTLGLDCWRYYVTDAGDVRINAILELIWMVGTMGRKSGKP
jgi:hypothetical protein